MIYCNKDIPMKYTLKNEQTMTEQTRKEVIQEVQKTAYISLQSYMRQQYYYGEEDWDEELPYIEGAYRHRLWASLLESKPVSQEPGSRQMSFDEVKERLYEKRISFFDFNYKNPVTAEEFDVLISMYDEALAMSGEVGRQVLEDYLKEKLAYEKTCEACDKELEMLLAEHNALFEIDIVSFSPESFYGYVALKDNLDVNSIYPTSLSTISQDTKAALAELKEGR
jgi:hypothetical protein